MNDFEHGGESKQDPNENLWVCPQLDCNGELSYPVGWRKEAPGYWQLELRCPECEHVREGLFDQAQAERLDEELARGYENIRQDFKKMAYSNMEDEIAYFAGGLGADIVTVEEVDSFVRALGADMITAADFQIPPESQP